LVFEDVFVKKYQLPKLVEAFKDVLPDEGSTPSTSTLRPPLADYEVAQPLVVCIIG